MQYDFRKVQRAINEAGKTLREIAKKTGVHEATISRSLRTGRAHQSTALALTKVTGVPMKDIVVETGSRKSA